MDKTSTRDATAVRVLLVVDWAVDPHAVVAAASRRAARGPAAFDLVVPAWLHGVDWAGDPHASFPCAQRQLETVRSLLASAGLAVAGASVRDPDPTSAILDALAERRADELLLCSRDRRFGGGPLDLVHRVRRLTGLPVTHLGVARRAAQPRRRPWLRRRAGHCAAAAAPAPGGAA
jgi:hypothetical protein